MYGIRVAGGASQDTFCNVYADVPNRFTQTISPTKKKVQRKEQSDSYKTLKISVLKALGGKRHLIKKKDFKKN